MTGPGGLRVSDAERSAVADALSHHYADGRLDRVELDERLDRAMSAKTRSDLAGLFEGLPGPADPVATAIVPPAAAVARAGRGAVAARGPHRGRRPALTVFLVLLVLTGVGQVVTQVHVGWLLVALVVVLAVRRVRRR